MVQQVYCTDGSIVIVDDEDFDRVSSFDWWKDHRGCPYRQEVIDGRRVNITMAQQILCGGPGNPVWNINKDYADQRRGNLSFDRVQQKPADQSAAVARSGPRLGKKYKGINEDKRGKGIAAYLNNRGVRSFLGYFPTPEAAARAYDAAAYAAWGTDCYLNFPEDFGLPAREPKP